MRFWDEVAALPGIANEAMDRARVFTQAPRSLESSLSEVDQRQLHEVAHAVARHGADGHLVEAEVHQRLEDGAEHGVICAFGLGLDHLFKRVGRDADEDPVPDEASRLPDR